MASLKRKSRRPIRHQRLFDDDSIFKTRPGYNYLGILPSGVSLSTNACSFPSKVSVSVIENSPLSPSKSRLTIKRLSDWVTSSLPAKNRGPSPTLDREMLIVLHPFLFLQRQNVWARLDQILPKKILPDFRSGYLL
jgi:hypothetical protein